MLVEPKADREGNRTLRSTVSAASRKLGGVGSRESSPCIVRVLILLRLKRRTTGVESLASREAVLIVSVSAAVGAAAFLVDGSPQGRLRIKVDPVFRVGYRRICQRKV